MARLELFTVWREPPESLLARTVGAQAWRVRLVQGGESLAKGNPPLPLYLFGPRGIGKSHAVSLARPDLEALGLEVRFVPEDIPAVSSVAELMDRTSGRVDSRPTWESWAVERPAPARRNQRPTVLIIEGLDRRLGELGRGPSGRLARQELREVWTSQRDLWVVGTGVELPTALSDQTEPFYGFFDPEAIVPLDKDDAATLFDRVTPSDIRSQAHYRGRRDALLALAGGSPRVVITLAESVAGPDAPDAARDALLSAVDRFTPHYQLRFRDLTPTGQHVVDLLAAAPRRLNPSEVAARLGGTPTTMATQMRRFSDDGLLTRREDARATWYEIAEPLFRFWLEYRRDSPANARVSIAASLLEALYSPQELVGLWWQSEAPDEVLDKAIRRPGASQEAARRLREEVRRAPTDTDTVLRAVEKAQDLALLENLVLSEPRNSLLLRAAEPALTGDLQVSVRLAIALADGARPKAAFSRWLGALSPSATPPSALVLDALDAASGAGAPWKLSADQRRRLSRIPVLRVDFAQRGRLRGHPPLLSLGDLRGAPLSKSDRDLGYLLAVALAMGADDLAERSLLLASDGGFVSWLPASPKPALDCPVRPDLLVAWATRMVRLHRSSSALTWARSLADVPEPAFAAFRDALHRPDQVLMLHPAVSNALVALGIANPGRLENLGDGGREVLRDVVRRASALARQLAEHTRAPLHPELEQLRMALTR